MRNLLFFLVLVTIALQSNSQTSKPIRNFEKDTIVTLKDNIILTFLGHASLMIEIGNDIIYVDPVSSEANYSLFPKGNLILITHEHDDHLDQKAIKQVTTEQTKILISKSCLGKLEKAVVLRNGQEQTIGDFGIQAVPAYNIQHLRNGIPFHSKGDGNGYVISYSNRRIYIAGDTENIVEMSNLKDIDLAFLPMNLPFTMTPKMVADAALSFMPKILYPYHTGNTDLQLLKDHLKNSSIELRLRKMR